MEDSIPFFVELTMPSGCFRFISGGEDLQFHLPGVLAFLGYKPDETPDSTDYTVESLVDELSPKRDGWVGYASMAVALTHLWTGNLAPEHRKTHAAFVDAVFKLPEMETLAHKLVASLDGPIGEA